MKWSHFLLGWFSTDFWEFKPLGQRLPPQSRVRETELKPRLSVARAQCWPDSPRKNPSVGEGPARTNPLHLAWNRGRHPIQAPDL